MKPNLRLKHEREIRGWSQARVAEEINSSEKNISRWERGISFPYPYYREKLCLLFGKTAQDLGFVEDESQEARIAAPSAAPGPPGIYPVFDPTIPPLPNEGREIVGRQELLDNLVEQVCAGKNIALSGLPGVGKTALAVTLVQHPAVRATFRDGILWAGLGPRPNLLEQLNRWEMLLGLPPAETAVERTVEARALALRGIIGRRRLILVIDDAWELASALPFKIGGPGCVVIATTRFPRIALGIARDTMYPVHELNADDGLALLAQLAPDVIAHDVHAAHTLIEEVGGLPLALTLLGKYLQAQSHSGQPRRLQAALTRLRSAPQRLHLSELQAPLERPPSLESGTPLSLQSAIAVSDQRLDENARNVLRALSVFPAKPNSFSEEAALAVAQASVETLDVLADAGLLESSGVGRYTLHQTIADYASAHLTETLAGERLVAYITTYIEQYATDYEALELESRNIIAGLKYAFEIGRHARFIQGVNAFAPFLLARGFYDLARLYLQRAYQIAIWSSDILAVATILLNLGQAALRQGDYKQAGMHLREGLTLARECDSHEHSVQILSLLGEITLRQHDYARAEIYFLQTLEILSQAEPERLAEIHYGLARATHGQEKIAEARQWAINALNTATNQAQTDEIKTWLAEL